MIWRREDKRDILQCTESVLYVLWIDYVVNRYVVLLTVLQIDNRVDNRVYGK